MKLVFANINCWKNDLFVQPLPLRSTVPHLSEWFCLNKKNGVNRGNHGNVAMEHVGHISQPCFLSIPPRLRAQLGVLWSGLLRLCFKKKVVTRFSREMRVWALWYGPYGIQHIETMNKIIKPNTIFSRSSVLGSTSAPAKKLTFFLRIWQERAGWTRRSAIRSVHLCEENHCCLARHYFQKDQTITTPNFNIDITYLKVDPFSKPSFLQSWYLC